ncbi:MAG: WG repeat-containing protein [Rikenellaceae bacterium]
MKKVVLLLTALVSIQSLAVAQYAKWIVEPIYEEIGELDNSFIAVKRDGKWGYINQDGVEFIACAYEQITPFYEGVAIATTKDNELQAIIHDDGSIVDKFKTQDGAQITLTIDPRYPYFGSEMLLVTNGLMGSIKETKYTKWGYINKSGTLQIPIMYLSAMPFCEGKAGVADEKMRFSYIDNRGNTVIANNMNGGRSTGAFGFYKGVAMVSDKKKFSFIDESGRKTSDFTEVEPAEIYYAIDSSSIYCSDGSSAIIDSLGRINRVVKTNGFVTTIVDKTPDKERITGETHFILDGQKVNESAVWITKSLAVMPYDGKLGVIKVQDEPVVDIELSSKSVHSIFGNIEPLDFTLTNDTQANINNLEIKCDDDLLENSSIPTTGFTSSFSLIKPTDAEVDIVQKHVQVTQRGVLLMDKSVDIIVIDEPAINIIGRNDLIYYKENNTASLSVDIQNRSKYLLKDAILTMNNYQTKITVEPNSTINCPTFFGVIPDEDKIEISISVKQERSQIVTKQGTMSIDKITKQ